MEGLTRDSRARQEKRGKQNFEAGDSRQEERRSYARRKVVKREETDRRGRW
jgi:hypothetical protein